MTTTMIDLRWIRIDLDPINSFISLHETECTRSFSQTVKCLCKKGYEIDCRHKRVFVDTAPAGKGFPYPVRKGSRNGGKRNTTHWRGSSR